MALHTDTRIILDRLEGLSRQVHALHADLFGPFPVDPEDGPSLDSVQDIFANVFGELNQIESCVASIVRGVIGEDINGPVPKAALGGKPGMLQDR